MCKQCDVAKPLVRPVTRNSINVNIINVAEGIKEKERAAMHKILQQIATIKDNCYLLRRHMWNDVNEDWPFYTEEEKRMLKRSVFFLKRHALIIATIGNVNRRLLRLYCL